MSCGCCGSGTAGNVPAVSTPIGGNGPFLPGTPGINGVPSNPVTISPVGAGNPASQPLPGTPLATGGVAFQPIVSGSSPGAIVVGEPEPGISRFPWWLVVIALVALATKE